SAASTRAVGNIACVPVCTTVGSGGTELPWVWTAGAPSAKPERRMQVSPAQKAVTRMLCSNCCAITRDRRNDGLAARRRARLVKAGAVFKAAIHDRGQASRQRPWAKLPTEEKTMTGLIIFLIIIAIIVVYLIAIYNGLVTSRNAYKNAFAQIDVQLTRR